MGKFFLAVILFSLVGLAAYAGYKTIPFIQAYISSSQLVPHLTRLFSKSAPAAASGTSATSSGTPALETPPPLIPALPPAVSADTSAINSYLVSVLGLQSHATGHVICAHRILKPATDHPRLIYLWAICQEYYTDSGIQKTGSGISVPVSLVISHENNSFQIVSHRTPRAGDLYASDLIDIFPTDLVTGWLSQPDKKMLTEIQDEINLSREKI